MIYLIVGLDHRTLAPWHSNVRDRDAAAATRAACARASADGVDLIVAAVIGPNSTVVDDPYHRSALRGRRRALPPPRPRAACGLPQSANHHRAPREHGEVPPLPRHRRPWC